MRAKLEITWLDDGKVSVSGPIGNEPISLWMLEKAKDAIKQHNANPDNHRQITPAGIGILDALGNGHRG